MPQLDKLTKKSRANYMPEPKKFVRIKAPSYTKKPVTCFMCKEQAPTSDIVGFYEWGWTHARLYKGKKVMLDIRCGGDIIALCPTCKSDSSGAARSMR